MGKKHDTTALVWAGGLWCARVSVVKMSLNSARGQYHEINARTLNDLDENLPSWAVGKVGNLKQLFTLLLILIEIRSRQIFGDVFLLLSAR